MNSKITYFILFATGVAIGSIATWQYVKKKYEQIAQEEIESVKEVFSNREKNSKEENADAVAGINHREKPDINEYASKVRKMNYSGFSEKDDEVDVIDTPYTITPEEFGEFEDYEKISLTFYADQILADDIDELVEDIDDVIGINSLTRFGEYEDDALFVRNDRLKADYEVLMDKRNYSDVIRKKPHQMEER